ncbi:MULTISPECIES: TM2 domain-containing protein [Corynebacterium]|nr:MULTISPECIES: TM2 domain-containing protein [Corynebacterium]MCG7254329.1 TM2 domain-containing protein [Corynebacterium hadale]MCG7256570.1 TM2 domain-containing protein [Corynebacterium hadale]MCG7265285.1 TM2 domain-containing protein [Corynebacterium hadale]
MTNPQNQYSGSHDSSHGSNDSNVPYAPNNTPANDFRGAQNGYATGNVPANNYSPAYSNGAQPYGAMAPVGGPQPGVYGEPKSWVVAALLAFFLGGLGVHNFYLGYTTRGIVQIVLNGLGWLTVWFFVGFFLWVVLAIWVLVEFVMILARAGSYKTDVRGMPLK